MTSARIEKISFESREKESLPQDSQIPAARADAPATHDRPEVRTHAVPVARSDGGRSVTEAACGRRARVLRQTRGNATGINGVLLDGVQEGYRPSRCLECSSLRHLRLPSNVVRSQTRTQV